MNNALSDKKFTVSGREGHLNPQVSYMNIAMHSSLVILVIENHSVSRYHFL